jgi:hypothetical protein
MWNVFHLVVPIAVIIIVCSSAGSDILVRKLSPHVNITEQIYLSDFNFRC